MPETNGPDAPTGIGGELWSKKEWWLRELERVEVLGLIEFPVFSCDHKSIKPSPVLFDLAFQPFGVSKKDVVFVGDSMVNDIEGAKRAGFSTVWINSSGAASDVADFIVPSLLDLQK